MARQVEIVMPRMGVDMNEGAVLQWYKAVGDRIEKGQPLIEVESEKTVFQVESWCSGTLAKILIEPSDEMVPVGQVLALVDTSD